VLVVDLVDMTQEALVELVLLEAEYLSLTLRQQLLLYIYTSVVPVVMVLVQRTVVVVPVVLTHGAFTQVVEAVALVAQELLEVAQVAVAQQWYQLATRPVFLA
jgi:hypothetical protein